MDQLMIDDLEAAARFLTSRHLLGTGEELGHAKAILRAVDFLESVRAALSPVLPNDVAELNTRVRSGTYVPAREISNMLERQQQRNKADLILVKIKDKKITELQQRIAELEKPVLPDDVAEWVKSWRKSEKNYRALNWTGHADRCKATADLLERQEYIRIQQLQHIQKQDEIIQAQHDNAKLRIAEAKDLEQRIEQLEASNKDKSQLLASFRSQIKQLETENKSLSNNLTNCLNAAKHAAQRNK